MISMELAEGIVTARFPYSDVLNVLAIENEARWSPAAKAWVFYDDDDARSFAGEAERQGEEVEWT